MRFIGIDFKFITRDFSGSESGTPEFQACPREQKKDIPESLSDIWPSDIEWEFPGLELREKLGD